MARRIEVEIIGDSKSLERAFARSERSAKQFGRTMERAGRGSVVAAVGFHGLGRAVGYASASFLGAAGFTAAVKAGFEEMFAGQKVAAQTTAALRSTGGIAGVTAKQISTLATSMQKLTGYDDEAIQSAENLLLTFTNVRNVAGRNNDIFNQATQATLNLSRTFDQDLSASAVQLGKALNDPIRGVTALRRVGVSFTEAQQAQIKHLVESNDVLGAQRIILQELTRETGNAARAYGQTLPGQLDILQGNLQNLAGELASTLNPEVTKLTRNFNRWLEDPEHKKQIIEDFANATAALGAAAKFAANTVGALKSAWDKLPDFGKHKGLIDLLPGAHFSGLDLLHKLGIGGGGGGGVPPGGPAQWWWTGTARPPAPGPARPPVPRGPGGGAAPPTAGLAPPRIPGIVSGAVATPGLRLHLPGMVSGAVATPGLVRPPGRVTGAYQFYRPSYEAPARLQLAQARAEALGLSLRPILLRMRQAAYRALHSGRLAVEAQTDAWNAIKGINDQLKQGADRAARAQRRQAMQLAGASGAQYQFAYARGGPTIHIEHFHSAASNPRALEEQLAKRARARAQPRRGAR